MVEAQTVSFVANFPAFCFAYLLVQVWMCFWKQSVFLFEFVSEILCFWKQSVLLFECVSEISCFCQVTTECVSDIKLIGVGHTENCHFLTRVSFWSESWTLNGCSREMFALCFIFTVRIMSIHFFFENKCVECELTGAGHIASWGPLVLQARPFAWNFLSSLLF